MRAKEVQVFGEEGLAWGTVGWVDEGPWPPRGEVLTWGSPPQEDGTHFVGNPLSPLKGKVLTDKVTPV